MKDVDPKIYSQTGRSPYRIWLEACNERDVLENELKTIVGEVFGSRKSIKILDIGCAIGSAAQRLISVLDSKKIEYEYTGIDPYQEQLDQFVVNDGQIKNKRLIQSTLESFQPKGKFDFAFAVHVLYYVPDLRQAILKIVGVADKAVIVHHGMQGINTIQTAFPQYVKQIGPNVISTYRDVARVVQELNAPFVLHEATSRLDISKCRILGNDEGRKLISFFLEDTEISDDRYEEVCIWMNRNLPDVISHDIGILVFNRS